MKTSGVIKKNWEEILTAAMRPDYLNEKRERKEGEREREERGRREKELQLYYWLFLILFFTGIAFNSIFSNSDAHWNANHDDRQT